MRLRIFTRSTQAAQSAEHCLQFQANSRATPRCSPRRAILTEWTMERPEVVARTCGQAKCAGNQSTWCVSDEDGKMQPFDTTKFHAFDFATRPLRSTVQSANEACWRHFAYAAGATRASRRRPAASWPLLRLGLRLHGLSGASRCWRHGFYH